MNNYNNKNDKPSAEKQSTATYNFIPLSSKVIYQSDLYKDGVEMADYHSIDSTLKTGEIHLTITAETPIYIAGEDNKFYKNANDNQEITGSTLRGLIHNNMQILGYGKMAEHIEDYKIYYRDMTSSSTSAYEGLKKYYNTVLGIKTQKVGDKSISVTENVNSGYITKEDGKYFIYPTTKEVIRIPHSNENIEKYSNVHLQYKDVFYRGKDFSFTPKGDYKKGVMLFTGKHIGNKPNARYIFPEFDDTTEKIEISKEDILSYEIDYKMRARVNSEGKEFWALPKQNEKKALFYIRYGGSTYFGMSRYLRIGYKHNISEGIPDSHKNDEISFVDGILGYADKDSCLKSRVSFGDCAVVKPANFYQEFKAILGEPRPSFFVNYVKDEENFNDEDFSISGYKQYWLKDFKIPVYEDAKNAKVMTTIKPLNKDTQFKGVIRFKNLHREELGLLLWAIALEEGCYHSIGMGKPLGLGRVNIKIDNLYEVNFDKESYTNLANPYTIVSDYDYQSYINAYDKFALPLIQNNTKGKNKSIKKSTQIKNFFYMRKTIVKDCHIKYIKDMGLDTQKITKSLQTITDLQKIFDEKGDAPEPKIDPSNPWAKLSDLYN